MVDSHVQAMALIPPRYLPTDYCNWSSESIANPPYFHPRALKLALLDASDSIPTLRRAQHIVVVRLHASAEAFLERGIDPQSKSALSRAVASANISGDVAIGLTRRRPR